MDRKKIAKIFNSEFDSEQPCIYFLIDDDEIVYVGQTTNLKSRIFGHLSENVKSFDDFTYQSCTKEELGDLEAASIVRIKPKYNTTIPKNSVYRTKAAVRNLIMDAVVKVLANVDPVFLKPSSGQVTYEYIECTDQRMDRIALSMAQLVGIEFSEIGESNEVSDKS